MKTVIVIAASVSVVALGIAVACHYTDMADKISEAVESFKEKSKELKFPRDPEVDSDEF